MRYAPAPAALLLALSIVPLRAEAQDIRPARLPAPTIKQLAKPSARAEPIAVEPGRVELDGYVGGVSLAARGGKLRLDFRATGASLGGVELAFDPDAAPQLVTAGIELVRSLDIVEAYAPLSNGVEQTFTVARPAATPVGTLAIALDAFIDGDPASLVSDGSGGYHLVSSPGFGFRMSRVTVIDATGDMLPAFARGRGPGKIELVVPAATVAAAAWPIVIDPFLDLFTFFVAPFTPAPNDFPDVAYGEGRALDAHIAVWRNFFTPTGDFDVLYQLVAADPFTGVRQPILQDDEFVFGLLSNEGRPRAAFLNDGVNARYAVVLDTDESPISTTTDSDILIAFIDADGTWNTGFAVDTEPAFTTFFGTPTVVNDRNPFIAADPANGVFLVGWEVDAFGDIDIIGTTVDNSFTFNSFLFFMSLDQVVPGSSGFSNQTEGEISARPIAAPTGEDAWVVVYEDDALGATAPQVVAAFIPTSTAIDVNSTTLPVHLALSSSGSHVAPDVAATPAVGALPLALIAHAVTTMADENIHLDLVQWDNFTATLLGSRDLDLSSTLRDHRPAVLHRFLPPLFGEPHFLVAYDRLDATAASSIRAAEIVVSPTTPFIEVVGDEVVSRDLGTLTNVRGQFTDGGVIGFEDALLVQQSTLFGGDVFATQWTDLFVAGFGGGPVEDFDTQPTAIPGGASGFPWLTSANTATTKPWAIVTGVGFTGDGAQSGAVAAQGDSSTLSITVEVADIGQVSFIMQTFDLDTSATGDKLTFSDNGVELGYWTGNRFHQKAFAVTPGSHTFEWKLVRGAAATARAPEVILDDIEFPPLAAPSNVVLTATPSGPATSQPVAFDVTFSGVGQLFEFDFGDGSLTAIETVPTTTHAYTVNGSYTATVTVTDPAGATATGSTTVVVTTTGGGGGGTTTGGATTGGTTTGGSGSSGGSTAGGGVIRSKGGGGGGGCAAAPLAAGGPGGLVPLFVLLAGVALARRWRQRGA